MATSSEKYHLSCPYCGEKDALKKYEEESHTKKTSLIAVIFSFLLPQDALKNDRYVCSHCGKKTRPASFVDQYFVPAFLLFVTLAAVGIFLLVVLLVVAQ